ncbi:MAG: FkbM family methyltransferase [Candidatus Cloacimonetes bacterium]|nr:FkbM family methyltransferase [Candidatus Cloacimonadota bacterium]
MITLVNKIYKQIVDFLIKCLIGFIRLILPNKLKAFLFDEIIPTKKVKTNRGSILFFCPGLLPLFRANTLLSKEPETIKWIEKFKPDTVFWDIGANVGIYSIYAGLDPSLKVYAFEPAANNFNLITKNIKINKMDERISALSIAFNAQTQFSIFYMSNLEAGSAHHSFGEPVNQFGEKLNYQFKQSMIAFSIDDFISSFDIPFPNYIKIDVDGIEHQIISGAKKTLRNKQLFSILIELDSGRPDYNSTIEILESCGFIRKEKHSIFRDINSQKDLANYIFEKTNN